MIAEAVPRRALADYADRFAALSETSQGGLFLRELPLLAQVDLRADSKDAGLMERLASALGFPLPVAPNTAAAADDRRAIWLAPDEWLIVGPENDQDSVAQTLRDSLAGAFGSIVDVSANRTVLEIRGHQARDLLAHGMPIDLDARSFGPGRCAQTLLAKAQVIVERRDDRAAFHLYVRSSFARYVADWLLDAAADPTLRSGR